LKEREGEGDEREEETRRGDLGIKKRLSQKGSLFNFMIINNIVFIIFHINLIIS